MGEIKFIELSEKTKEQIDMFLKLKEDADKYIRENIGISQECLGHPEERKHHQKQDKGVTTL